MVVGHQYTNNDAEAAEDEESYSESDLLDGRPVVDHVRRLHHDVLVGNGKGVVHVRHVAGLSNALDLEEAKFRFSRSA